MRFAFACVVIVACTPDVFITSDATAPTDATLADGPTSSDGGNADTGPTNVNIATLEGLAVWLVAEQGVSTPSNTFNWKDQSSNANVFTSTGLNVPSLVQNSINNRAAVHFAAAQPCDDLLANAPMGLTIGTNDFLIEVVARYDNSASVDPINNFGILFGMPGYLDAGGGSGPALLVNVPNANGTMASTTGFFGYIPTSATTGTTVATSTVGYNDGMPHVFALRRRNGADLSLRVNGVVVGTGTLAANTTIGSGAASAHLGAQFNATAQCLDGDIAQMVIINGTTDDATTLALEKYLMAIYGIP